MGSRECTRLVTPEYSEGEAGASAFVPESEDFLRLSTGRCGMFALASVPRAGSATMPQNDRKTVFDAAKSAVNAYAKNPSDGNAARVQSAWGAVKDMQAAPFWHRQLETWLRSNPGPDDDLKHVIQQAIEDARNRGRDYVGQTELAVRAVRQVRPDMNASDALAAVHLINHGKAKRR